ncbi:MAG TPA: hypothetical protein VLE23_03685, partial [Geminicoccaceae bacterium]|nr:hypothetical protein [Geminicoccaceae bacterium]
MAIAFSRAWIRNFEGCAASSVTERVRDSGPVRASALGVAAGGGAAAGRRVLEGSEHGSVSGVARWEKGAGSSRLRVRSG